MTLATADFVRVRQVSAECPRDASRVNKVSMILAAIPLVFRYPERNGSPRDVSQVNKVSR